MKRNTKKQNDNNPLSQNNEIIRIPRPMGTTEISKNLHKNITTENDPHPKQTIKESIQKHLIMHYINNNYRYNDIPYTTTQFSNHIQIEESITLSHIYNHIGNTYNKLTPEEQSHIFGVLNQTMISGYLRSQQAVQHHTQLLLESQGTSYKPFISSEVTKALKLSLDALNLGTQMHNRFFPNEKGSPSIIINNQNQQNSFSIADAQMLINNSKENVPLIENEKAKEGLYIEYGISNMPEVRANLQVGVDHSREGLNFANMNKELIDEAEVHEPHTDRRAKEFNIDLDSDQI